MNFLFIVNFRGRFICKILSFVQIIHFSQMTAKLWCLARLIEAITHRLGRLFAFKANVQTNRLRLIKKQKSKMLPSTHTRRNLQFDHFHLLLSEFHGRV